MIRTRTNPSGKPSKVMTALLRGGLLVLLALAPVALAQPPDRRSDPITKHPGYVDFSTSDLFGDEATKIHISIKDAMLRLVAAATRESEPDLANMIRDLRAIEVMVFEVDHGDGRSRVRDAIAQTADKLKRSGWEPAIDIRLEQSGGFLYFRFGSGDNPVGLAGIFLDGDEAVFINIVGTIDPLLLGRLAARFNISLLDQIDAAIPKPPTQRKR